MWPGIRVGYNRTVYGDELFPDVTITTLSLQPLLFKVNPLLSIQECADIVATAEPELEASAVMDEHNRGTVAGKGREFVSQSAARTSTQTKLPRGGGPLVERIEARVAQILAVQSDQGEPVQVLRYQPGQKYDGASWKSVALGRVNPRTGDEAVESDDLCMLVALVLCSA